MQQEMVPATAPIEQMVDRLGVERVFGEPLHDAGVTIIPVAQVAMGFGYGGGYGRSKDESNTESEPPTDDLMTHDEGGGSGGGAGGRATPCGYIRLSPDGVAFEPIEDKKTIALAGLMLAAWSVFWLSLTIRTLIKAVAKTRQMKHKRTTA